MRHRRVLAVLCVVLVVLSLVLIGVFAVPQKISTHVNYDGDGPLYLSPHIARGEIQAARDMSAVDLFRVQAEGTQAYAGLITVNETLESHYFFLHLKAKKNASGAPLLLWLQGGPGSSSLFGQFMENGPLGIDSQGHIFRRMDTIQEFANVVYLDQPVGAGYSRTGSVAGYARSLEDLVEYIHLFLQQFLVLFPEYQGGEFYVAGESYGARPAVGLAVRLHDNPDLPVNLRGVICGVGFLGPLLLMANMSDYFHQFSIMDHNGRGIYQTRLDEIQKLVIGGNALQAVLLLQQTLFVSSGGSAPTLFEELTGYKYDGNVLQSREPAEFQRYRDYVASEDFKMQIHVGLNATFQRSELINFYIAKDYFRDITDMVLTVLKNYRLLAYFGQLDPVFSVVQNEKYFRSLQWDGAEEFRRANHTPWFAVSEKNGVSGYVTAAQNFVFTSILQAGHYAGFDQTQAANKMMRRFMNGLPL
uniref:Putative serine carboxypeptidase n=1 Tax=Ixodes ricinus TaxID=34613 RepID=A0A147BNZ8_IXORI